MRSPTRAYQSDRASREVHTAPPDTTLHPHRPTGGTLTCHMTAKPSISGGPPVADGGCPRESGGGRAHDARVLSQRRELCAFNTGGSLSPECSSDAMEPVQHPFQQGQVGMVASLSWPVDHDQVLVGHIADQNPDDAEGKVKPCGDLGDGQDLVAEDGGGPLLHGQLRGGAPRPRWWRPASRSPGCRGWAGCARRSSHTAELVAGPALADRRRWSWRCLTWLAGYAYPARLLLAFCSCWTMTTLDGLRGMVGAHGGRAAWSSARRLGVRTSPVRLTSTVIS
jgi:hypothetical protein